MAPFRRPPPLVACEDVREALSARLDGEEVPLSDAAVDAHLAGCRGCEAFRVGAARLAWRPDLRASKAPPEGLSARLADLGRGLAADGPRPPPVTREPRRVFCRARRWAATVVPTIIVAAFIPLGVSAHTHVIPTRDRTPCTSGLHHSHPHG